MIRVIIILLSSIAFIAQSKPLTLTKTANEEQYVFNYEWLDQKDKKQTLSFALDRKGLNSSYRHFKALRPSLLKMHGTRQLKLAISKLDPKKGRVQLIPRHSNIDFKISSKDPEWASQTAFELQTVYEDTLNKVLKDNYYTEFPGFYNNSGARFFRPDHRRFAEESLDSLTPVVEAIQAKMPNAGARQVANYLLSWIQSIPYNTMESRIESNGAGFLPPLKVLDRNQGDCDSKVTLMAAIMKRMFPNLRMAIIYIPKHAVLGLNISHLQQDYRVTIDGLDYTIAEPVGPALMPLAEAADSSKRYLESGSYQYELLFDL